MQWEGSTSSHDNDVNIEGDAQSVFDENNRKHIELDVEQATSDPVSPATCCLICLEEWRAGERICQSHGCRHVFHQACIVSWLVHHRSDCPACRQPFLPTRLEDGGDDEAGVGAAEEYEA